MYKESMEKELDFLWKYYELDFCSIIRSVWNIREIFVFLILTVRKTLTKVKLKI